MHVSRRAVLAGGSAAIAAVSTSSIAQTRNYRRIACEEAFILPETLRAYTEAAGGVPSMRSGPIKGPFMGDLLEIGEARIKRMTDAGIDMAVLSHTSPGVQHLPPSQAVGLAQFVNDRLAATVRRYPTRFAGLATIAPQLPSAAAAELERSVRELGLKGAIINSSTNDEYLDHPKFLPIFEAAAALDVPIYIHPREPSPSMGSALVIPGFTVGWGYAVETGTNALRLMASGLFDRLPTLRIVIGHMGETIPMLLDRLDNRYEFETSVIGLPRKIKRKPSDYFKENFFVSTSGMNYSAPLAMTIQQIGIDRVLFAADYPLEDQTAAVAGIERSALSDSDKKKIFDTNVTKVFKL